MTPREQPSWQDLLDLVTRLDGGSYDAVSVQVGDVSVTMSRGGALPPPTAPVASAATPAAAGPTTPAAPTGATIDAPMVGVFYRRPSPSAAPFVEEGAEVTAETTIGILEIMKMMSPVVAGRAGVLTRFLVADGEAVEFGQPLAALDPGGS
jgi:Biotin carboxyl carrier protein